MKEFDPAVHPAPDLAIEVDITSRSIARQPIYAALGVSEVWRHDGEKLVVLKLDQATSRYSGSDTSSAFPFLSMGEFARWIERMEHEEQTPVLREFQQWVRKLPQAPRP